MQLSAISSLHTLVVAVETDNELLSLKFGNNTTSAANYLATLFASLDVIYERDLFVRLLQGYTIFRPSSTTDPYVQGGAGNASAAQLSEFATYWGANYGAVRRGLAMMLSGKQPSANQSSGIAYLGSVCSTYSVTQVFKFGGSTGANDARVVGHELGHNFGSRHTHCYPTAAAPIDMCYNAEGGCYSGPTSCPAPFTIDPVNGGPVNNVTGSIMSYCHLLGGCSAGSIFHPETVNVIAPLVQSRVGVCVFPQGAAVPTVAGINPNIGPSGGGPTVTVTGSNFQAGAAVSFANRTSASAATGITVVNSSQITATLPAHAPGLTDVIVSNPDQLTGTLRDGFTFDPGPILYSISPDSGTTAGGTAITITGANLQAPATVTLGGVAATSVSVPNSTTITALTGPHAAGTVDLTVTVPGPASATLSSAFYYSGTLAFYTITPCRVVDTRTTHPPALVAQANRTFTIGGTCNVPASAKSISLNLTVVGPANA
ncbi:MAG: IPT/TIG domain-containing protein, partial [Gemmatimonadales bacterium]